MPSLTPYDPLAISATKEQINYVRDFLEGCPIQVEGNWFDFDDRSEKRMRDALALWDMLGVSQLEWTLADNSKRLVTKVELQTIFEGGMQLRAVRALSLHTEASTLKDSPETTLRDLVNWFKAYAMPDTDYRTFLKDSGLV